MLQYKNTTLLLNLTHPTQNGKKDGTWLSYSETHLDKTMSSLIAEIDTTPINGETTSDVTAKIGFLTQFIQTVCLKENPDYDADQAEIQGDSYSVDQHIHYDCTLEEFALALNQTLGSKHVTVETTPENESSATKHYAMMFSKAEFYKKDWVQAGLTFKSEIDLLEFWGRGKLAPDFTVHNDNQGEGMNKWLRAIDNEF